MRGLQYLSRSNGGKEGVGFSDDPFLSRRRRVSVDLS